MTPDDDKAWLQHFEPPEGDEPMPSKPLRYHTTILNAEAALEQAKVDYLKSWGWTRTCEGPGSYWLWQHDDVPGLGRMICGEREAINATKCWNGIEGKWLDARGLLNMED